jgi:hypothetical protein
MRSIVRLLERPQLSTLEAIVITPAQGHVESFARHIL